MKTCSKCKTHKELFNFSKNKNRKDGFDNYCKNCRNNFTSNWKLNNKDKIKEYNDQYYDENTDYMIEKAKIWSETNVEKYRVSNRKACSKWASNNKDIVAAKEALRRVRKIRATPLCLDENDLICIDLIYKQCREITELTGVEHHVDHNVPLVNELVCGLHVPCNLRVISAKENLSKSNKFEIGT